ncbi:hypothetical protein KDH_07390 [Dictyobacter sp. S3.2.2.5]|uniref:ER-bound oxygenase mpaB/mpaB'/Rubber oxygenase catalytic domain-containing protein n=1 Tax=Dictyobacter halimunensis TaxID=3026934 RepID=A0ABQ6FJQ7_9CHLR|nr:hypothetical protein KDH_07390 [Dictyobacter sp. S3.2.2.5]
MDRQQPLPATQTSTPPTSLIRLEEARQRFGDQKVQLLIELMYTGDTLADAVIKELEELGFEARAKLNSGIKEGLEVVEQPSPAIQAFLQQVESYPAWVDKERLQRGSEAFLSVGNVWLTFSLGPGSLTHTYSSPSIAQVLVKTGNLTTMAQRRLLETGAWNVSSILPGGLLRGADGYATNLQVRLLHARVRQTLLRHNWDQQALGTPINQVEMTRTWLDFTYVPFNALHKFGITFSEPEISDMYHFWQYIAYLLGIDERLYRDIVDQASAQEILELIDNTTEGTNQDSQVLVRAMLDAVTAILQPTLKLPSSIIFDLVSAITHHLHGNRLADQLAIKKTWISALMPVITLINRVQRAWNRRSPVARRCFIDRTVTAFLQIPPLQGSTTYQRNVTEPTQQELPKALVQQAE